MVLCGFDREKESCTAECYDGEYKVSYCTISCSRENGLTVFTISSWHTAENSRRKGYGRESLGMAFRTLMTHLGLPDEIRYNWNGKNQYVYGWLESRFSPVCLLPIEEQKYMAEDDWCSHVYRLDKSAVLEYIGVKGDRYGKKE